MLLDHTVPQGGVGSVGYGLERMPVNTWSIGVLESENKKTLLHLKRTQTVKC